MEILGYRKVCSRWVPRLLTGLTRQFRKPREAGCEELERTSTTEANLRFCNAGKNA
jgi:hypothetical protein